MIVVEFLVELHEFGFVVMYHFLRFRISTNSRIVSKVFKAQVAIFFCLRSMVGVLEIGHRNLHILVHNENGREVFL